MTKAIWNGALIAESTECEIVEGNRYFPPESVRREYLRESERHTSCHWKGVASYYDVVVDGKRSRGAAWFYRDPSEKAENIRGRVAFWRGVQVS